MKSSGKLLLVVAAILVIYAVLIFDPSVSTEYGRVSNLQRLSWQQNSTIVGVGLGIIGALLLIFGPEKPAPEQNYDGRTKHYYHADDATLAVGEQFAEAIRDDDLATMKRLLSNRSVSAHGRNQNGRGWLQYATAVGSVQAVETLLEHGASPQDKDDLGKTALEHAEAQSNSKILALFAIPNTQHGSGVA